MDKLISAIIPVYNTASYLGRCLDSIIANSYDNIEIICINDGSTDDSLNLMRMYEEKDNRIVVIDVPNGGVSKARNIGLERAKGEFICFIDSDDWLHKEFFSSLIRYQKQYNADIIICEFFKTHKHVVDAECDFEAVELYKNDEAMRGSRKRYIGGRLFKKEFIGNTLFSENLKIGEDTVFNIDCFAKHSNVSTVYTKRKLYYYFQRADSATNSAKYDYYYDLGKVYLERASHSSNLYSIRVYLRQAFRELLLSRKRTKDKHHFVEVQVALSEAVRITKEKKPFFFSEAIMYYVFARFPNTYNFILNLRNPLCNVKRGS